MGAGRFPECFLPAIAYILEYRVGARKKSSKHISIHFAPLLNVDKFRHGGQRRRPWVSYTYIESAGDTESVQVPASGRFFTTSIATSDLYLRAHTLDMSSCNFRCSGEYW